MRDKLWLEKIWKKTVAVWSKLLSQNLSGYTQENHVRIAYILSESRTQYLPKISQELCRYPNPFRDSVSGIRGVSHLFPQYVFMKRCSAVDFLSLNCQSVYTLVSTYILTFFGLSLLQSFQQDVSHDVWCFATTDRQTYIWIPHIERPEVTRTSSEVT